MCKTVNMIEDQSFWRDDIKQHWLNSGSISNQPNMGVMLHYY